ncbi:MAG: hypothetical protein V3S71_03160 [Acidobacteriota bacterium]
MALGITVVEVAGEETVEHQLGLHLGDGRFVFPTGLWAQVSQEFVKLAQVELGDMTGRYGFCMVEAQVWDLLGLSRPEPAS